MICFCNAVNRSWHQVMIGNMWSKSPKGLETKPFGLCKIKNETVKSYFVTESEVSILSEEL